MISGSADRVFYWDVVSMSLLGDKVCDVNVNPKRFGKDYMKDGKSKSKGKVCYMDRWNTWRFSLTSRRVISWVGKKQPIRQQAILKMIDSKRVIKWITHSYSVSIYMALLPFSDTPKCLTIFYFYLIFTTFMNSNSLNYSYFKLKCGLFFYQTNFSTFTFIFSSSILIYKSN